MTSWTIDGHGDTGTRAAHCGPRGKWYVYNVSRLPGGFWLAELKCPDGSKLIIDASEMTEAGAHARCERHAATQ